MRTQFEYVWKKRRYVHMEWIFCFRKSNKRSIKNEKRILPSRIQRIEKTKEVQKVLQTLCDKEDDDSSEKSFLSVRFTQKLDTKNLDTSSVQQKILEVDLTDSSSGNSSLSYKRDKQNKSKRDQKAKSIRKSSGRSTQKVSRLVVKEKNTSKRYKISSDSSDSTELRMILSAQTLTGKPTSKCNIKSEKIVKRETNSNHMYSSDSESDENDTRRVLSISKRILKDKQQNKKMDNSCNKKSKDKMRKYHDSIDESEDEKHKRRNKEKTETSWMTSYTSNDKRKHKSSTKSQLSNIQEDDSDNSSSKEFQKIKFQKVNRDKYSKRQLINLDTDYTKSPCVKNFANNENEKHINEQLTQNLNDIKGILKDCKKICSNFQMHIETIEHLYGKEDEEQLILKVTEKIDKLRTRFEEKQKDLTTSYQLWSENRKKSATKRSYKVISDDKKSSEEHEKYTGGKDKCISDDEQDRNKTVSECDSEEIFSGSETRTLQKIQAIQHKADTSRIKNNLNNNETNSDDEDRMLGSGGDEMDESKSNDKNNTDMRDDLATFPVLGSLKEKTSTERSIKKQLFSEYNKSNNETRLTDENINTNNEQTSLNTDIYNDEIEIEYSPLRDTDKKKTLKSDGIDHSNKRNIINESMDMFDTSVENEGESRTEVEIETNYDKGELSHTSKDKSSHLCESSLQDKVPTEIERKSLSACDIGEKKDLSNQDDQEKIAFVNSEEVHDNTKTSGRTNTDDNESLDDAEALAKKALLATDSDTSDILPNENIAKLTEDLIANDTNETEKKNEMENNDSDVNSVSTVMLSIFKKEVTTEAEKDVIIDAEKEIKIEKKSDNQLDKRSRQEMDSSDEDAKAERAAKKALLESNSDDSTLLSESEKLTDKTSESDSSEKNTKAKLSLLASFSENSTSESALSETRNVSKNTKRNESQSEETSIVAKLKKRRLYKNYYYKNDKKLRMSCKVHLIRLSAEVLKCHSHALRMSREYLEHKELKRYRELSEKRTSIVLYRLI